MTTSIPITLVGENLGKRHLYLNTIVQDALKRDKNFVVIKNLPEQAPIDRLFKIDLAVKIRNVDYIIQNLKDSDMLFVTRALKSTWLLEKEYEDIVNPQYLEDTLYPEMITTAVTKMQHWIHLNLNDELRCRHFFYYYKEKNRDLAMKFLLKCSKDDIQNEFLNVVLKITPHYLKVLCEKCPQIAKVFFDLIYKNNDIKTKYLNKDQDYFNTLKHLLKTDADMVLDITEKVYNRDSFGRFSALQTKYIMKHHKNRFWKKPELYTGCLLNTKAVANSLDSDAAKELVLKLARATYLAYNGWFNYKAVEPLINRLKPEEKVAFRKKVFVAKDVGQKDENWPYEVPQPPCYEEEYPNIFDDYQPEPDLYENLGVKKRVMKRKGYVKHEYYIECCMDVCEQRTKTLLDKLFDEYRFVSFGQTLYDLRKRIAAESSPQNREFMMLVLVSKSGGRPDAIALLLELLARHYNEPANVRSAIVRSLVKRASVWRVPETSWNQLLEFGKGLGLDGKRPEADCFEGLHAVVIRSLLLTGNCEPVIQKAFLDQFSTLSNYSLSAAERKTIAKLLPEMLFSIAKEKSSVADTVKCLDILIDTLNDFKIKLETYPGLIDSIAEVADKDLSSVSYLITRLFKERIARKQLFRFTFKLIVSKASYVNALKHDITVLDEKVFVTDFVRGNFNNYNVDLFLSKLSIYFSEENGLASKLLNEFKTRDPMKQFGRPLAFLLKNELEAYLHQLDELKDDKSKLLGSSLRANAHITRPALDIHNFGWKKAGAKFIANRFMASPIVELDKSITELLKWKKTAKIALVLAKRTNYEIKVLIELANMRPNTALKAGLKLIKVQGDKVDPLIWETIKPILNEIDFTKSNKIYIVRSVSKIKDIPLKIKPDYSTVVYTAFRKISLYKAMPPLCHIEILLPNVDENFVENLLTQFINEDFKVEKLSVLRSDVRCIEMYIRILIKYILLSKNEEVQKNREERYLKQFFATMEEIRNSPEKKELFSNYLKEMLKTFKYSKVFFDPVYVSPLPIIQNTITWLQNIFPILEHFKVYAQLHLFMLYYKTARQCLKLAPEVFGNEKRKRKEAAGIVGNILGKYIASEVKCLITKYFESIPELYIDTLNTFVDKFGNNRDFLCSIIKSIIDNSEGLECRVGVYLVRDSCYELGPEKYKELLKYVKESNCVESQWIAQYTEA